MWKNSLCDSASACILLAAHGAGGSAHGGWRDDQEEVLEHAQEEARKQEMFQ